MNPSSASGSKNIFTPNYDGYNDNVVFTEASGSYTIRIFDLTGRKVRELPADSNTWDGKRTSGEIAGLEKSRTVVAGLFVAGVADRKLRGLQNISLPLR